MAQITLRDYLQETEDAISSKRVDEALASCQYILAYFPESLEAQRLLGEVYLAQGKLEDAQQAFDWVLTNDPENVVAYCSRALVSERSSDYDTALDCYQQAYELSRGNGQIRQAFNQLSAKAGQPGFMLSRAGLARLYMRGDLLSQAVQEWDIVLAMTPDRLDARTGLLEVYWRLGVYDRATQLAEQILQDVPGCVKALLLLAYVTAPQDMLRSQELVKKTEIVDPDLVMAHDLFADQMASRQGDPFIKLLQKPPVTLGAKEQATQAPVSQAADPFALLNNSSGTVSADALASWGSNENWSNDTTLVKPRSEPVPEKETGGSAFPSWMAEGLTSSSKPSTAGASAASDSMIPTSQGRGEDWNAVSLSQAASLPEDSVAPVEPWDSLQDALNNINPEVVRQISDPGLPSSKDYSWLGNDAQTSSASSFESVPNGAPDDDENFNSSFSYGSEHEANNGSATPAWLSMLNQNEPQVEVPSALNAVEPPAVKPQSTVSPPAQPSGLPHQIASDEVLERSSTTPSEADDGDEELFFGPNWLKTLGAASLDGTEPFDFSASAEVPAIATPSTASEQNPVDVSSSSDQLPVHPSNEQEIAPSQQYPAAEEPQTTQEDDAWASWKPASSYSSPPDQESYQPWPDFSNQSQDDQSFWSLPQQENPSVPEQEQPSWMSQLSQSSQGNSASAYTDWASQPSDPRSSTLEDAHDPAKSGSSGEQNMPELAYDNDPWNARSKQAAPQLSQDEIDPWAQLSQQAQEKSVDYNWLAQLAGQQAPAEPTRPEPYPEYSSAQSSSHDGQEKTEQNLVTTLEELEQKLLSRGFTPLEPNSLASIAQSTQENVHTQPDASGSPSMTSDENAEPSLSSALAELGNFDRTGANPVEPLTSESYSLPETEVWQERKQPSEPLWLSSVGTASDPVPSVAAQITTPEKLVEDATVRVSAMPASAIVRRSTRPLSTEPPASFVPSNPTPPPAPAVRMNVLLDSELETTMKRPAVRLQPMQQQATPRDHSGSAHSGRGRAGQRPADGKGSGNVSHRDRLVRGYQAQLIGDFDEAMQEYRLIIRNAPELLGEVVSNVRALLKLAPNYSAGYRVLGDAYMRQGEYLQAMESYNKALTMAKKAKG